MVKHLFVDKKKYKFGIWQQEKKKKRKIDQFRGIFSRQPLLGFYQRSNITHFAQQFKTIAEKSTEADESDQEWSVKDV